MSITFSIFLYPGTEPIDLATFGVLSMARRVDPEIFINTVAEQSGPVALANGLTVIADFGIDDWPGADVLVVTGGPGWVDQCAREPILVFLNQAAKHSTVAGVCTGGMILAASGLLTGTRATTKRRVISPERSPLELLSKQYPDVEVVQAPVVDSGRTVTSGGVTFCIDATLHLLARFCGDRVARETERILEFNSAQRAESFVPDTIHTFDSAS